MQRTVEGWWTWGLYQGYLLIFLPFRAYCVGDLQKIDDVSRLSVRPLSSVTLIIGYRSSDIKIGRYLEKRCIFVVFCRCGEGIFTFSCFVLLMIVRFVWWHLVYHRKSDIIIGNRTSIIGNHHQKMLWKRLDSNISHYFLTQKVLKGYPASRVQSSCYNIIDSTLSAFFNIL